jgi:hypothetical protein
MSEIHCSLPTRVRVSPAVLSGSQESVGAALARAAGRALANSGSVVLATRAGGLSLRYAPPAIEWTGDGLAFVSDRARVDLEALVVRTFARAVLETRLGDYARDAAPPISDTPRLRSFAAIAEPFDPLRYDEQTGTYYVPSYDDKGRKRPLPLASTGVAQSGEASVTLTYFSTSEQVLAAIINFFPDVRPRGNTRYGVYGIWGETSLPTLFWVEGVIEEGTAKGHYKLDILTLISGELKDGHFVPSPANTPAALVLGARYRQEGLLTPRTHKGVTYSIVQNVEGSRAFHPVFLRPADEQRLRGKVIRFGVAAEPVQEIVVHGTRSSPAPQTTEPTTAPAQPQIPVWALWHNDWLPAEPQEGFAPALWKWYVWFNVRPASVRANPLVQKAFNKLEADGEWEHFNPLFLYIHYGQFYKAFCQQVAIDMLATSRSNMTDLIAQLDKDSSTVDKHLTSILQWLYEPVQTVRETRGKAVDPWALEAQLANRKRDKEFQDGGGILPAGVVTQQDLDDLQTQIDAAKAAISQMPEDEQHTAEILGLAEQLDPLLIILTLNEGSQSSLENAVARFGQTATSNGSAGDAIAHIRRELNWLIDKTKSAEQELGKDVDIAYKLSFVQEVANQQLAAWFEADPFFRQQVQKMIEGPGLLAWIGLGIGLLVVTFAFPPLGAALAAGVSVTLAIGSVREALRLARLSNVRIAQAGFRPLVTDTEVTLAIVQATVDVVFAVVDLGALGKSLSKLGSGAAREAAGALGRAIEPVLAGWRLFGQWPEKLLQSMRSQITAELERGGSAVWKSLGEAERKTLVEELLLAAQEQMHARYRLRLGRLQRDFAAALESGKLKPRDIEKWLRREFPRPQQFFDDLAKSELQSGGTLFEDTVGRRLAGLKPLPPAAVFEFAGALTQAELEALQRELGPLAELLTPNRLRSLGEAMGITYANLARRLKSVFERVSEPALVLEKLENLLVGSKNPAALFEALEESVNPARALGRLTPEMLEAPLLGGAGELVSAAERGSPRGEVARLLTDLDARGTRQLYREVRTAAGESVFERWDTSTLEWIAEPRVRIAGPVPAARVLGAVTPEARSAVEREIEQLASATRASGGPTSAARRLRFVLDSLKDTGHGSAFLEQILNVGSREGKQVAADILEAVAQLLESGATGREIPAITDFLRRGGEGRALAEILGVGFRSNDAWRRQGIRRFLDSVKDFTEGELRGISIVMAERGYSRAGGEAVLAIMNNYDRPRSVFAALFELAPHSEGLGKVIDYLRSLSQNLNQAALAQLFAARQLLQEFPGRRLVFEAAVDSAGKVIREIDVRVVTALERQTVLDVEIKEVTSLFPLGKEHVRQQFARDIVRSVNAPHEPGRALEGIRWLIRESELLESGMTRDQLRNRLKELLSEAFNRPEFKALSEAEQAAARHEFETNFDTIVQLF